MKRFQFSPEFIEKYSAYLSWIREQTNHEYQKSDYWRYQSSLIQSIVDKEGIIIGGDSGNYIPPDRSFVPKALIKTRYILRNLLKVVHFLHNKAQGFPKKPRVKLLSYYDAFDAVMRHDPVADVDLSPYRINFKKIQEKHGIIRSTNEMKETYFAKERYNLSPHLVETYYIFNLLRYFLPTQKIGTVLEIGAGNGNLASELYHSFSSRTVIVDLPETLCLSIPYLANLFPSAKMLMPHEIHEYDIDAYNFIFLVPDQINIIQNNSIDLALNVNSFQEMTREQIRVYFDLIQRTCKNGGYFFTKNRVEKIPGGAEILQKESQEHVIRFSEYPWQHTNEVIIYEICRLSRLVQLDDCYIRLERIRK